MSVITLTNCDWCGGAIEEERVPTVRWTRGGIGSRNFLDITELHFHHGLEGDCYAEFAELARRSINARTVERERIAGGVDALEEIPVASKAEIAQRRPAVSRRRQSADWDAQVARNVAESRAHAAWRASSEFRDLRDSFRPSGIHDGAACYLADARIDLERAAQMAEEELLAVHRVGRGTLATLRMYIASRQPKVA